jgi:hypothetical protein
MLLVDRLLYGGLKWVLEQVVAAVDAELDDEQAVKEELLALQMRAELGQVVDEERAALEAALVARLREVRARRAARAGGGPADGANGADGHPEGPAGGAVGAGAGWRVAGVEVTADAGAAATADAGAAADLPEARGRPRPRRTRAARRAGRAAR